MGLKPKRAKFQRFIATRTFSNLGLNEGGRKMCIIQRKTGHILQTVRDRAKVINHL